MGLMWNGTNLRASVRLCSLFNLPVVRRKMSAQHRFSTFTPQQNTQEAKHSVCVSARVSVWMFMWKWTVQVRWRRQRGGAACLCGKSKCCSVWPMWTFFFTWFTGVCTVTFPNNRPASTCKQWATEQMCKIWRTLPSECYEMIKTEIIWTQQV